MQEERADEEDPEAERVEARKGDVARADLQRDGKLAKKPSSSGITTRKIMVVPCIVKIAL